MLGLSLPAAADFWIRKDDGRAITHQLEGAEAPVVVCMQGRKVVMETRVNDADGLEYQARFFNVQHHESKTKVIFRGGKESLPVIFMDGVPRPLFQADSVEFDGRLIVRYQPYRGVSLVRTVYPSVDKALVLEHWECRNQANKEVSIEVMSGHKLATIGDAVVTEWTCGAVGKTAIKPGATITFHTSVQARRKGETVIEVSPDTEQTLRMKLAEAAWSGPGRLEIPDASLLAAYNLQKLHVLETPIETHLGVITHNGSLTYTPGIWANDPVEYSSPLFPFFGSDELNEASMNMYRIWLDYCRRHGIDPFPGSFEHESLKLVQKHRGDDAMVLYGLSKFLLFQGDRAAAEEMWPLVEFSVASIEKHMTPEGIVASKTDEMEGRYPTGDANLSTSALAYGGYRLAARLAESLGKPETAEFDKRADALRQAIESFFGAEVEGFQTYRYFKENTVLRGWILLPLAMDITERQDATLDAMVSNKLWPKRMEGGDILAASDRRETEWGRETYYALRVLFKAGRTEEALDLTQRVVKAQIFGPRGPYPDEDAIDMLCPGSLYPRVFTEGMFGIVPTGLDSFECTPWLPKAWPRMALRDVRAFGKSWDLAVERDGDQQKVTVSGGGKTVMSGSGPAGKTYQVNFSAP